MDGARKREGCEWERKDTGDVGASGGLAQLPSSRRRSTELLSASNLPSYRGAAVSKISPFPGPTGTAAWPNKWDTLQNVKGLKNPLSPASFVRVFCQEYEFRKQQTAHTAGTRRGPGLGQVAAGTERPKAGEQQPFRGQQAGRGGCGERWGL